MAITRLCIPATFSHLLRTIYPSIIKPYAERVDEIVIKTALEAGGFSALAKAPPTDPVRSITARRLFIRLPLGGMGVFSCVTNSVAAFLGSAALTCETVADLGIDPTADAAEQLPYVQEHRIALEQLQQRLPDCDEIKNWTLDSLFGTSQPRLQQYIGAQLAKAERQDILAMFPDTEDGRRQRAEFEECGAPKAGAWVQARASDMLCRLSNGEFWVAFALRMGLAERLYTEVHPSAVCKACKQQIGPNVPRHAFGCPKPGRRGRNLRHTATKNCFTTIEREAAPGTNVIPEPFVVAATGAQPTDAKFAKSRADIHVRLPNGFNYVVDVTLVDSTLAPLPANTPYIVGKVAEQAFNDKVTQYTSTRFNLDKRHLRAAAFDIRGAPSESTLKYLMEIAKRQESYHPGSHYSVIASRIYQRVSVAVQRAIAYNVMEYRLWRVPVAVPGVWQLAGNKGGALRESAPLSHSDREAPATPTNAGVRRASGASITGSVGTSGSGGVSARSETHTTRRGCPRGAVPPRS